MEANPELFARARLRLPGYACCVPRMPYRMLCAVNASSNALRRACCVPRVLYRMPCAVYGRDWADGGINSNSTATKAMLNEDLLNRDMIEI